MEQTWVAPIVVVAAAVGIAFVIGVALWVSILLGGSFKFVSLVEEGEMGENGPQQMLRPIFVTHRLGIPILESPLVSIRPESAIERADAAHIPLERGGADARRPGF